MFSWHLQLQTKREEYTTLPSISFSSLPQICQMGSGSGLGRDFLSSFLPSQLASSLVTIIYLKAQIQEKQLKHFNYVWMFYSRWSPLYGMHTNGNSLLQFPRVLHVVQVLPDSTEGFPALFCNCSKTLTCRLSQRPMFDFKVKLRLHRQGAAACCQALTPRAWSLIKGNTWSTPTAKPTTTLFPSLSVYYDSPVLSPGYILLKFHFCEFFI